MNTEAPPTMSVPEAGRRYFDVDSRTAYRMAERGAIPVLRVGKRLFVKTAELERQLGLRDPRPAT